MTNDFDDLPHVLKRPRHLCLPADVNGAGTVRPDASLLCYRAQRAPGLPRHALVAPIYAANGFGTGRFGSKRVDELCLPATLLP